MAKLLGIGIDENLQWAIAESTSDGIVQNTVHHYSQPLDDGRELKSQLNELIKNLKKAHPKIFSEVNAIGISTIGVVDTLNHTLNNITSTRKPLWRGELPFDFQKYIEPHMRDRPVNRPFDFEKSLLVNNDASAIALAEFAWGLKNGRVPRATRRLLYLRIDEGINVGIIHLGESMEKKNTDSSPVKGSLLASPRHPEAGHVRPQRHELDTDFEPKFSGCMSHTDCYEGLASSLRLRKQWGGPDADRKFCLRNFSPKHPIWTIEANYIAQLAYTGVLFFSPQTVIIGGNIGLTDKFIEHIRHQFLIINNNYFLYTEMGELQTFIQRGLFGPEGPVWGALQLAERASRGMIGEGTEMPPGYIPH